MNSKQVPYSYCCNCPLRIRCYPIGFGLVLCSGDRCPKPELRAFKFSDNQPQLEDKLNQQLSKLISKGAHRHINLIEKKQRLGMEEFKKHNTETVQETIQKPRSQSYYKGSSNYLKRPYKLQKWIHN